MQSILDRVRELLRPASDWLVARCARLPRHTLAWASIGLALILLLSVNLFASSALRNAKADLTPGVRPICQATKLLDPDTIVRGMAEQCIAIFRRNARCA